MKTPAMRLYTVALLTLPPRQMADGAWKREGWVGMGEAGRGGGVSSVQVQPAVISSVYGVTKARITHEQKSRETCVRARENRRFNCRRRARSNEWLQIVIYA